MGGLPAKGDLVPLNPERPQDDAERQVERLEDGPLLDVELQVAGGAVELLPRLEGAVAYGRDKLERKGLDAIVVNDIARADIGFDTAENEVTIVTADGERAVPRAAKAEVARAILAEVSSRRAATAKMSR